MQKNAGNKKMEVSMFKHSDFSFVVPFILLLFSLTEIFFKLKDNDLTVEINLDKGDTNVLDA